ncbi:hypothetical protein [Nocardioides solisilvae]|uniref:hypothetical protein n=1 Tax=Nocardioides solisilvae TaxID=1542435 RepID=UPI000D744845|nr:hypothetical protein [Nocardioides solisilvae]
MSIELTADPAQTPVVARRTRERHEFPVRSVLHSWAGLGDDVRRDLRRSLPAPVGPALMRLVDPLGMHGHSDAVALAEAFRQLDEDDVEELSGTMPFPLFWAVARLAQNLR